MISKESCDTADWSIEGENSALPTQEYILKYYKKIKLFLKCK